MASIRVSAAILTLLSVFPNIVLSVNTAESHHPLGIDWDPAPSPEDGPPLSRAASRNMAMLPAQIGGIVGAYVVFVFFIGLIMLFVGRRLRASAQTSRRTLDVEMVKPPTGVGLGPSPISPQCKSTSVWPSPIPKSPPPNYASPDGQNAHRPGSSPAPNFSWPSPQKETFVTFDERLIENEKAKAQSEMERLYAAVMEHDAQNASKTLYDEADPQSQASSPRKHARWPSISSSTVGSPHMAPKLRSPTKLLRTPRSSKHSAGPGPSSPLASPPLTRTGPSKRSSRASSIASDLSGRSKRKGIRGLTISSPTMISSTSLPTHSRNVSTDTALTPLHPPPPPPPTSTQHTSAVPTSPPPHTLVPTIHPPSHQPNSIDASLFPPASAHHNFRSSNNGSTSTTRSIASTRSAATPKPLPFRSLPPSASQLSPTTPTSPNATRTTVLDRRPFPNIASPGMLSAGGRSMLSPGQVPYSPYMPFTPITPITPRLVTRQERRRMEREGGREVVRERVKGEAELWGDAYHDDE